jgi:hypothetical protein
MSERVTWERCPVCGRTAAVGWIDDVPVEFDCTAGCRLPTAELPDFADPRMPVQLG